MASDCNRWYNFISECRRFESARGENPPRGPHLFFFLWRCSLPSFLLSFLSWRGSSACQYHYFYLPSFSVPSNDEQCPHDSSERTAGSVSCNPRPMIGRALIGGMCRVCMQMQSRINGMYIQSRLLFVCFIIFS